MSVQVHDVPGRATNEGRVVLLDGPEGTALSLTPDAAEEMGRQLIRAAEKARHSELVQRGEPYELLLDQPTGNTNGN